MYRMYFYILKPITFPSIHISLPQEEALHSLIQNRKIVTWVDFEVVTPSKLEILGKKKKKKELRVLYSF